MEINPKYRGRISAAWWSKTLIAFAAVLSVILLPFGFDWESALVVAGVLTVTFFEFRVHRYFLTGDPRAPDLGFRNQSCFAAGILLYGLYHAFYPTPIPPAYRELLDEPTLEAFQNTIKNGYLVVGMLGGLSQFGLAWYYRGAKAAPQTKSLDS
jgi:hypothetical protein